MSAIQGSPDTYAKLWIMPVILELFAFPFAWISVQMLHDHEPWRAIAEYAVAGIILCTAGVVWAFFRKRIAEIWPWNKLRKSEESAPLPVATVHPHSLKPQHNVQCTGFKVFADNDFIIATLSFRNVPNSKLLGKFESPTLRVIYYEEKTGQEIADMNPVEWWKLEYGPQEINANESYAIVASYFQGAWKASEIYRDCTYETRMVHSIDLPAGDFHLIAKLSGSNDMTIPNFYGILTLREDGSASFQPTEN